MNWTPDPKRAVLLIHDMQEYFLDAYSDKESPKVELISNIKMIRENVRTWYTSCLYSTTWWANVRTTRFITRLLG